MNSPELARAIRQHGGALLEALAAAVEAESAELALPPELLEPGQPVSWKTRIETEPEGRRIGVAEVAEALGMSESWVYKKVRVREGRLPHRKFAGQLVFLVGEIRAWRDENEEIIKGPPRRIRAMAG